MTTAVPVSEGGAAPWARWVRDEQFRLSEDCLYAIVYMQPLRVDVLDAMPPGRAAMWVRLAAGAGTPVQHYSYEQVLSAAHSAPAAAGPGWLTGRAHRTCLTCGRTCWDTTATWHRYGCADA